MKPRLRRLWLAAHRWLALSLGTVLLLAAALGVLLTFARPLDQALHPSLFRQPANAGAAPALLAGVRDRLQQEFGAATALTLRPPRVAGDTLWVMVRGAWEGTVYFDASGRELGRRGEHEGWFNLLFELHSSLLAGEAGKAVLAASAGAYALLLVSGLVLWWPRRWPPSFSVATRAGGPRFALDLHKVAGSLAGIALLVPVATGAYMAWPPLRDVVTLLAGEPPSRAPALRAPRDAGPPASLDALVAAARARFPQGMVGYVQVPAQPHLPVRVRMKLPDEPHPNGLSSVWFHPRTGEVLRATRWDALDAGSRLVNVVYPLHTGALGGPPHLALNALAGALLAGVGGTGWWLWWRRSGWRRGVPTTAARGSRAA